MESKIFEIASSQGIWTVLFVFVFFYILKKQEQLDKTQEKRECQYQEIIKNLSEKYTILENIENDIQQIKNSINKK